MPQVSATVQAIYDYHKKVGDSSDSRGYLGASIIGHHCERYLWYVFRGAAREEFDGRMYRLLETGDLAEPRFVTELRAIGCTVHDVDPTTGEQFEVSALGGLFSGHMDGCAIGIPEAPKTWHVLEFKTHNDKSFKKLEADGVEKSKPMHYAQMQIYMHLTGMKRALYLAMNKNDDQLYSERVKYDKHKAEDLMAKAERIIKADSPAERISDRQDWWQCRHCSAHELCFPTGNTPIYNTACQSCRQCCRSTPVVDGAGAGQFSCDLGPLLDADAQHAFPKTCTHFIVNPAFLRGEPVMSGKDEDGNEYLELEVYDGGANKTIQHGYGRSMWSASDLQTNTLDIIMNSTVQQAKELFGARPMGVAEGEVWDETEERVRENE